MFAIMIPLRFDYSALDLITNACNIFPRDSNLEEAVCITRPLTTQAALQMVTGWTLITGSLNIISCWIRWGHLYDDAVSTDCMHGRDYRFWTYIRLLDREAHSIIMWQTWLIDHVPLSAFIKLILSSTWNLHPYHDVDLATHQTLNCSGAPAIVRKHTFKTRVKAMHGLCTSKERIMNDLYGLCTFYNRIMNYLYVVWNSVQVMNECTVNEVQCTT